MIYWIWSFLLWIKLIIGAKQFEETKRYNLKNHLNFVKKALKPLLNQNLIKFSFAIFIQLSLMLKNRFWHSSYWGWSKSFWRRILRALFTILDYVEKKFLFALKNALNFNRETITETYPKLELLWFKFLFDFSFNFLC